MCIYIHIYNKVVYIAHRSGAMQAAPVVEDDEAEIDDYCF